MITFLFCIFLFFFWLMIKFRKHDDVPRFQIERMFIKILMFILKKSEDSNVCLALTTTEYLYYFLIFFSLTKHNVNVF